MSAKLPASPELILTLGGKAVFSPEEIDWLTTQQGRGKPSAFATATRDKFQSIYAAHRMKSLDTKLVSFDPKQALSMTKKLFEIMMDKARKMEQKLGDTDERNSFLVTGAPGIGKTYSLHNFLEGRLNTKTTSRFRFISGGKVTPVNLYKVLYFGRDKSFVTMFDDSDSVFDDEDSLNLLKSALDTDKTRTRKLSWLSESAALQDDRGEVPRDFEFYGSVVFVSNLNLASIAESDRGRHIKAFLDRVTYVDLKLHTRTAVQEFVIDGIENNGILDRYFAGDKRWNKKHNAEVSAFIREYGASMRSLSFRGAQRIGAELMDYPKDWKERARLTEMN